MTRYDLATLITFIDALPDDDPAAIRALERADESFGSYEGTPAQVEFDDEDGRSGRLLRAIVYHRQDGVDWAVPEGAWLDGASIPRPLWSIIGGPYEGKYRTASIVHDHYCIIKTRSWRDTHRMFHDAMRCGGVGRIKASVMFYAVYRAGPRWPDPGLEGIATASVPSQLDDARAEEFLRDCEAIAMHGLNPSEIEVLAEVREQHAGALEGLATPAGANLAAQLVIPGGSGTTEDVAAVVKEATGLPDFVAQRFLDEQIRIVACRGSVTDFERDLRGKIPRGWESIGKTWDSVPGAYFGGSRKRVVVATVETAGSRVVPDKFAGSHGSDNLVIHESLHGYDYCGNHAVLAEPSYVTARSTDVAGLSAYEKQAGQAGLEETFAETGAQFCAKPDSLAARCPNLSRFWESMPVSTELPAAGLEALLPRASERDPLGTVTRQADGSLQFDLRATGEGGAIGHALIEIGPTEQLHKSLSDKLFPDDGLESIDPRSAFFYG